MSETADDFAPVPDVVVHRGPISNTGYIDDPLLVVEVLSPATMSRDRGRKAEFYRVVPGLPTVLLVCQDEPRVEVWRRGENGTMQVLGPNDVIELPELDGSPSVCDIYDRVAF